MDWTTGLTFDRILDVLRKLIVNIMKLSAFLVSEASTTTANYNNVHNGALQLYKLQSDCLEKSIFWLETTSVANVYAY